MFEAVVEEEREGVMNEEMERLHRCWYFAKRKMTVDQFFKERDALIEGVRGKLADGIESDRRKPLPIPEPSYKDARDDIEGGATSAVEKEALLELRMYLREAHMRIYDEELATPRKWSYVEI